LNLNYNRDIPFATHNPSVDQPDMQTNTNSVDTWVTVDHHGFQDNEGGYHTVIHQDPNTSIGGTPTTRTTTGGGGYTDVNFPPTVAGVNQVFTANVTTRTLVPLNTDSQLMAITGLGGISQLTGDAAAIQGYQFIGGNVVMWGTVNTELAIGSNGTISFQTRNVGDLVCIPFPNNCWSLYASPFFTNDPVPPAPPPTLGIPTYGCMIAFDNFPANFTRLQFAWRAYFTATVLTGPKYQGFYWWAVGN